MSRTVVDMGIYSWRQRISRGQRTSETSPPGFYPPGVAARRPAPLGPDHPYADAEPLGTLSVDRSAGVSYRTHALPVFLEQIIRGCPDDDKLDLRGGTKTRETHPPLDPVATNGVYLPASGRLPWFAFFMRSFFSLRRRVLAMMPPEPGKGILPRALLLAATHRPPFRRDSPQRKGAEARHRDARRPPTILAWPTIAVSGGRTSYTSINWSYHIDA